MLIEPLNFEIPDNLIQQWMEEEISSDDPRYVEKQADGYFKDNYTGQWDGQMGWLYLDDELRFCIGYNEFLEQEAYFYYGSI